MPIILTTKRQKISPEDVLSEAVNKLSILGDDLARILTPLQLRQNRFLLGHILIVIPLLLLFLPVILNSVNSSWLGFWISLLLTVAVILIMSNWYMSVGKRKAIRVAHIIESILENRTNKEFNKGITEVLSMKKQIIWGGIFTLALIFYCVLQEPIKNLNPFEMICILIAIAYVGLLLGSSLYVISFCPKLLDILSNAKYRIKFIVPSKLLELKKISEISSSFTLTSAVYASVIIIFVFLLQLGIALQFKLTIEGIFLFLEFFDAFILISTLIIISYSFITTQIYLYKIVKNEKEKRIKKLKGTIESLIDSIDNGDIKAVEPLSKVQSLYDLIDQSSDSVIELKSVLKFLSSIFVAILPILFGMWLN